MKITDEYLPINKHSRPGSKIKPTKIAVHYVGNAGSSAKGNRNYFASGKVYASSHYIIGLEGEILRLIPENEISYATNQANSYTISIECCHPDSTGKFNSKTLQALIELCADICKRHRFNPLTDIIRHYDVTKKCCPAWWSPNGLNKNANADFNTFKQSVKDKMNGKTTKEEEDMTKAEVKKIAVQVANDLIYKYVTSKEEKVYSNINEIPDWGKATVQKLVNKGALKGGDKGLDLNFTLLRLLVINDRVGLYE